MERSKSSYATTTTTTSNGTSASGGSSAAARDETKKDERYFAKQQPAMDSETLGKLMMVEQHLFQADQATRSAWHLISKQEGRGAATSSAGAAANGSEYGGEENDHTSIPPPPPPSSSTASTMNSTSTGGASNVASNATTFSSSMMSLSSSGISPFSSSNVGANNHNNGHMTNAIPMARLVEGAANGSGSTATSMPNVLSSSPKYPIEIPRGGEGGRSSLGTYPMGGSNIYEKPLSFGLKTPVDLQETNIMAEKGRSRSSHNIFGFNRDNPPRSEVTLFTFTVKKSDSVLEKLGSKKASIQLQVDIETRMLNFLSPHDNRESYSCAAVTARPHSRL
ncbi:Myotubularin-like protein, partial [Globisporangium polare]